NGTSQALLIRDSDTGRLHGLGVACAAVRPPVTAQSRRTVQASRGCSGSTPAGASWGDVSGPATASTRSASAARAAAEGGLPGSRISCQSVTSSDDRRWYRVRISARAIDASQAATVRITIVNTWPVQLPW